MKNKGFTLVELLAVIVILAIIMIIAIPAVLNTMQSARRKTFLEYIDKVSINAETKYTSDQLEGLVSGNSSVIYNIKNDLNLSSTGDFDGYVLIDNNKVYVTLYNDEFAVYGLEYASIKDSNIVMKNSVEDTNLTIEALAKSASVSEYTYISNNQYKKGEVTLTKAIFDNGPTVNSAIKTLANGTYMDKDSYDKMVEHIVYTRDINSAPEGKVLLSAKSSEEPIYAWWDETTKTIYIGCKNNQVYLNVNPEKQFQKFDNLKSIDLSHYLSDDAETLYRFLAENGNLESVNVSHFNTSKVKNYRGLFLNLYKIKEIDVSHFDTSKAEKMGYMFCHLPLLTSLNLSNFKTNNVRDMEYFITTTSIKELHLESFDTSKVTNMNAMFGQNDKLEKIYVSNKFVTTNVTLGSNMFLNCKVLNGAYDRNKTSYLDANLYLTYV